MSSSTPPLVSVFMPAYNAEKYIGETLDSILNQTLQDFEIVVVNDGSTDSTLAILESYSAKDARVRVISDGKLGYTGASNRAALESRGKYLARSDADDISLPMRLQREVDFLESHPEIDVLGSNAKTLGDKKPALLGGPASHNDIQAALLFYCPLVHSSAMWRATTFTVDGVRYDQQYNEAADYSLWTDFAQKHRLANLPQILLRYRITSTGVTLTSRPRQERICKEIRRRQLWRMGIPFTEAELDVHDALGNRRFAGEQSWLAAIRTWLEKLQRINREKQFCPEPALTNLLCEMWFNTCNRSAQYGAWVFEAFKASELSASREIPLLQRLRFRVKSTYWYA